MRIGANNKKAHALRKAIGGSRQLFTSDVRGETWVTNRYWAQPLSNGLAALWPDDPHDGVWWTGNNDKTPAVAEGEGTPPSIAKVVLEDLVDFEQAVDLERVLLNGSEVYGRTGDGVAAPLYRRPSGVIEELDPGYLDMLSDNPNRRITAVKGSKRNQPVTVWRPLLVKQRASMAKRWILCGILMPIRFGAR